jgi:hypothetical protein
MSAKGHPINTSSFTTRINAISTLQAVYDDLRMEVGLTSSISGNPLEVLVTSMEASDIGAVAVLGASLKGALAANDAHDAITIAQKMVLIKSLFSCAYSSGIRPSDLSYFAGIDTTTHGGHKFLSVDSPEVLAPLPPPPVSPPSNPLPLRWQTKLSILFVVLAGAMVAYFIIDAVTSAPQGSNVVAPAPVTVAESDHVDSFSFTSCPSTYQGGSYGYYNCQGSVVVAIDRALPTPDISVVLDFPSSSSFFEGYATVPAGFTGTVTVPTNNEYEPSCVSGTSTVALDVYDGTGNSTTGILVSTTATIHQNCG